MAGEKTDLVGLEVRAILGPMLQEMQAAGKLTRDEARQMGSEWAKAARSMVSAHKTNIAAMKEAGKAAASLDAEFAMLDRGVVGLNKSAKMGSASMSNFARQMGDVGTMAAMGQSPLSIVITQGEQIYFAYKEAGGAAGLYAVAQKAVTASSVAFLAVAGPLTVALAAVGAAYYFASKDAERLDAVNKKAAESATAAQKQHEALADLEAETQRSWAIATGQTTEKYAELDDRLKKVRSTFDAAIQAEVKLMQSGVGDTYQHRVAMDNLTARRDAVLKMTREEIRAEIEAEEAKKRETAGRKKNKDAIDAEAKALALLSGYQQAELAAAASTAEQYQTSIAGLESLRVASVNAAASELERIDISERAAKAEADRLRASAGVGTTGGAREEAERAYQDAITAIEAEAEQKRADYREKMRKKEEQADKKALEAQKRLTEQSFQLVEDIGAKVTDGIGASYDVAQDNLAKMQVYQSQVEEYLTDQQQAELDTRVKNQKAATRRAFEAYKAAQIAQAIIGTASAFVAALDDAPYPINLGLAAASAGAGAIQITTIASQQPAFHSGGALDMAPDEVGIRAQRGEYMMSKQGRSAAGDATLARYNAGVSAPAEPSVFLVNAYRHSAEVDRYEGDRLARNGPYSRAIRGKTLPGVRT